MLTVRVGMVSEEKGSSPMSKLQNSILGQGEDELGPEDNKPEYDKAIYDWRSIVYHPEDDKNLTPFFIRMANHVKHRDNYICQSCRKKFRKYDLSAHHIVSRERGGKDIMDNLISLCEPCHNEIEPLNLEKADIIDFKSDQLPPPSKVLVAQGGDDRHKWVYGGYSRPEMA
jgi:hypothetical protein